MIFTEDDLDNCWENHKSYLISILNGEYDLKSAIEDLRSLVGSKYDKRMALQHETDCASRYIHGDCRCDCYLSKQICSHKLKDGSDAYKFDWHDSHYKYYKCILCGDTYKN